MRWAAISGACGGAAVLEVLAEQPDIRILVGRYRGTFAGAATS
jgi:hypothetical protein